MGQSSMKEIFPKHSQEIEVGDVIQITFSLTHAGYWKFGSGTSFRVIEKTKDGKIRMKSPGGDLIPEPQNPPIGGTKKHMMEELRKLSNFKEVRIFRTASKEKAKPSGPKPTPSPIVNRALVPMKRVAAAAKRAGVAPSLPVVLGIGFFGIAMIVAHFTKSDAA